MARFNDDPDVELTGIMEGIAGKAYKFRPDFGPEELQFVPLSQADWIPDLDSDEQGRGTMMVKAWLAKKNGWDRV